MIKGSVHFVLNAYKYNYKNCMVLRLIAFMEEYIYKIENKTMNNLILSTSVRRLTLIGLLVGLTFLHQAAFSGNVTDCFCPFRVDGE